MENKIMVMRVALRDVSRVAEEMTRGTITGESVDRKTVDAWAKRLCEIISRDIAIPLRNCDVGTAEEQAKRFLSHCKEMKPEAVKCDGCPLNNDSAPLGEFAWGQMQYTESEANNAKQ